MPANAWLDRHGGSNSVINNGLREFVITWFVPEISQTHTELRFSICDLLPC